MDDAMKAAALEAVEQRSAPSLAVTEHQRRIDQQLRLMAIDKAAQFAGQLNSVDDIMKLVRELAAFVQP